MPVPPVEVLIRMAKAEGWTPVENTVEDMVDGAKRITGLVKEGHPSVVIQPEWHFQGLSAVTIESLCANLGLSDKNYRKLQELPPS